MEVHLLHMTPILFLYKLIGGLPYIWHDKSRQVTVNVRQKLTKEEEIDTLLKVKRDRAWTIWSIFFGFLILAYFSYGGLGIMNVFSRCATTFSVILRVEDFIGMLTTLLLRIHMLGEAPALAKALVRMQHLCATYGFKANPYYWDKPIAVAVGHHVFGFICICYGNVSMATLEGRLEYFRIANMFEATVKPLVFNLFMMMYSRLINIQAMVYDKFISTVSTSHSVPHINIWTDQSQGDHSIWTDVPDRGPPPSRTNREAASKINKTPPAVRTSTSIDTEMAKTLLFDLHDSHKKVKNYFQFLTGLNLLHSTTSSIVSCFLTTIQGDQLFPEQVATVGLLVMTFFPILFLTNIPRFLNVKKRELRLVLTKMKHDKQHVGIKDQLSDILELLGEDPGFDVGGFFTLSRARMVSILSFISTYLVILLQFRVTETTSDHQSCDNDTTNAQLPED